VANVNCLDVVKDLSATNQKDVEVHALPPEKMLRQHIFRRHRFIVNVFPQNIGKIEGNVTAGVGVHYF